MSYFVHRQIGIVKNPGSGVIELLRTKERTHLMVYFVQVPVIALIDAAGPEEAIEKAGRIIRSRRLQARVLAGSALPVTSDVDTGEAKLLEEKCRVIWQPGLVVPLGAPSERTRCRHNDGHDGDHAFC